MNEEMKRVIEHKEKIEEIWSREEDPKVINYDLEIPDYIKELYDQVFYYIFTIIRNNETEFFHISQNYVWDGAELSKGKSKAFFKELSDALEEQDNHVMEYKIKQYIRKHLVLCGGTISDLIMNKELKKTHKPKDIDFFMSDALLRILCCFDSMKKRNNFVGLSSRYEGFRRLFEVHSCKNENRINVFKKIADNALKFKNKKSNFSFHLDNDLNEEKGSTDNSSYLSYVRDKTVFKTKVDEISVDFVSEFFELEFNEQNHNVKDIISNFDFSFRKTWYDGVSVYCYEDTFEDIKSKKLTLHSLDSPISSFVRLLKFHHRYGFEIQDEYVKIIFSSFQKVPLYIGFDLYLESFLYHYNLTEKSKLSSEDLNDMFEYLSSNSERLTDIRMFILLSNNFSKQCFEAFENKIKVYFKNNEYITLEHLSFIFNKAVFENISSYYPGMEHLIDFYLEYYMNYTSKHLIKESPYVEQKEMEFMKGFCDQDYLLRNSELMSYFIENDIFKINDLNFEIDNFHFDADNLLYNDKFFNVDYFETQNKEVFIKKLVNQFENIKEEAKMSGIFDGREEAFYFSYLSDRFTPYLYGYNAMNDFCFSALDGLELQTFKSKNNLSTKNIEDWKNKSFTKLISDGQCVDDTLSKIHSDKLLIKSDFNPGHFINNLMNFELEFQTKNLDIEAKPYRDKIKVSYNEFNEPVIFLPIDFLYINGSRYSALKQKFKIT